MTPPSQLVGARIRALRQATALPQDAVARAFTEYGFSWSPSTVARVEAGERQLTIEEFLGAPVVLDRLFKTAHSTGPRLLKGADRLTLTGTWSTAVATLRPALDAPRARLTAADPLTAEDEAEAGRFVREHLRPVDRAEQTAARSLSATIGQPVTAEQVREVALETWGVRLADHRDDLVSKRPLTTESVAQVKGSVTRYLLAQLAEAIEDGDR